MRLPLFVAMLRFTGHAFRLHARFVFVFFFVCVRLFARLPFGYVLVCHSMLQGCVSYYMCVYIACAFCFRNVCLFVCACILLFV